MAPKKKAKSIQRERKPKPSPLEQNTNIGDSAQQQVVKVVIQQPEQPKPKKRATKPKVDKKKAEAIEDLRSALKSYDEEQNKADQMGIAIPRELGVSPLKVGEIKNTEDILGFIRVIREKTQKIKELEARKEAVPAPKPNIFLTAPSQAGSFSPFIPTTGSSIQPAPQIQPGTPIQPGLVPPVPQSEIDRELAEIERSLDIAKSPEELAFEDSVTQINTNIEAIRNTVNDKYEEDGRLSDERVRAFKQLYETQRKKTEAAFVKLPKDSQDKLAEVKASVEELINKFEERLGEIERASQGTGGDPIPPVPPPSPDVEEAKNIIESYIQQLPPQKWTSQNAIKISNAFTTLGATDAQLDIINKPPAGLSRRQRAAELYNQLVGGRTPIPSPGPSQPKRRPAAPDPTTAARLRLINFVNDEDMEWNMSLLSDLKTMDASLPLQNAVSETSSDDDRRTILRQFLGLSPRPPRFVPPQPRPPVDPAPSIPGILNQSPQNIQQAFSLLQAYRDTPSATFNDFVIQALDIFAPGTAEGVRFARNEETRKAMVDGILAGGGAGSALAPGDDPTRPPAFAPGGLGPGRGRRNKF
jgi:hypothetical protein